MTELDPAQFSALLTAAAALVGGGGVWFGHRIGSRAQRATAADALIDQLQEELKSYRDAAERRATAQDERMNRMERHIDAYRTYAHQLRGHIFDEKPPPPPPWPDGLPQ